MSTARVPFRLEVDDDGRSVLVTISGEFDLVTCEEVRPALEALETPLIIVDLRAVTFMDSSGFNCLLQLQRRARREGFDVALVRGGRAIQRLFDVTNTTSLFRFVDDPGELRAT